MTPATPVPPPGDARACAQVAALVTEYLEGALSPAERAGFVDHLVGCGECGRYLAEMRATIDALGDLPPPPVSGARCDRLLARFRAWAQGP